MFSFLPEVLPQATDRSRLYDAVHMDCLVMHTDVEGTQEKVDCISNVVPFLFPVALRTLGMDPAMCQLTTFPSRSPSLLLISAVRVSLFPFSDSP